MKKYFGLTIKYTEISLIFIFESLLKFITFTRGSQNFKLNRRPPVTSRGVLYALICCEDHKTFLAVADPPFALYFLPRKRSIYPTSGEIYASKALIIRNYL